MPKKLKNYKDTKSVKFGEHLIFDAYGCNPDKLNNMELCASVLQKMCDISGMKPLTPPFVIKANSNETLGGKDPGGFSGFMMIQESHISIHTFVRRQFVTIDLYSCKEFKADKVIKFLKAVFETEDVDILKIDRGLKYPKENLF